MTSSSGRVPRDAAYSNLYGVRINGLDSVIDRSNFKSLTIASADMQNVNAASINGSSVNIALTNANPNELLATDSETKFISIPYTVEALANSVPKRTAADYTAFTQLFLTDVTNQITGNQVGNQSVLSAVAPAASRVYSLNLESSTPLVSTSMLSVTSSATGTTSFLDPLITVAQLGLKADVGGTAALVINSFTGNGPQFQFQIGGVLTWNILDIAADDSFVFRSDAGNDPVAFLDVGAATRMMVTGNLMPTTSGIVLGSDTRRFKTFTVDRLTANPTAKTVVLTISGSNLAPQTNRVFAEPNTLVTVTSVVIACVTDFSGVRFAALSGCPFVCVTGISAGVGFNLNVYNVDATETMVTSTTITVTYWILN